MRDGRSPSRAWRLGLFGSHLHGETVKNTQKNPVAECCWEMQAENLDHPPGLSQGVVPASACTHTCTRTCVHTCMCKQLCTSQD